MNHCLKKLGSNVLRCAAYCFVAFVATDSFMAFSEELSKKEPFYVNESTVFMGQEADASKATGVTKVSEGLWARSFPDGYQFYYLNGRRFTASRWDLPGVSATPYMTRWGMMVKKAGSGPKEPYTLVKPTGEEVQLPANWVYPTAFVDSLAIVRVMDGFKFSHRYITPDLKTAFPNLEPYPERFEDMNNTTPPLSEGFRAYCTKVNGYNLWGFIDVNGKIVIQPQFREARSFHCGLAWVKDKEGNQFFINKSGNKAFEPKWGKYDKVSDYDSGYCSAPGERFDETDYYDLLGNKVTTLKRGTPFYKGYAYCLVFDKALNKNVVHKVSSSFSVLEAVGVTTGDFNTPWYDEAGVAHFTSWMVDGGPCNGRYFYDYTVGPFSKEKVAPATMVTNDGKTLLKGFVDIKGHFVIVYDKRTK